MTVPNTSPHLTRIMATFTELKRIHKIKTILILLLFFLDIAEGNSCSQIALNRIWKLHHPTSFHISGIKVSWNASLSQCFSKVFIKYNSDEKVKNLGVLLDSHIGEVMLPVGDNCKVLCVSFGLPNMKTGRIKFSNPKYVWPPSYFTSVSTLANVAVFSTLLDCNLEKFHLKYCLHDDKDTCSYRLLASHTETFIRTMTSLDIQLTMGMTTAHISSFYRKSCDVGSTLWNIILCRTPIPTNVISEEENTVIDGMDEDENCRHLTIHPDELQTTALIDGLQPCSQYIFRLSSNNSLDSEEKIVTEQTLCL